MTADDLKALRIKYGLSTAQAAPLAMVTQRRWQQWESGKFPMPAYRVRLLLLGVRRLQPIQKERT